jgi:hypothetical protein
VTKTQPGYIGLSFYNEKMYGLGCDPGQISAFYVVYHNGKRVEHTKTVISKSDSFFEHIYDDKWAVGEYKVYVQANFDNAASFTPRDFSFRLYFNDKINIKMDYLQGASFKDFSG